MYLEETEDRNDCVGEGQQQFNRSTDRRPVENWQMEISSARELAAEGSTRWSQRSQYEVGVKWSQPCKDVNSEAEEHRPLEAVTKQRDWGH
jgi:hypothetical protein